MKKTIEYESGLIDNAIKAVRDFQFAHNKWKDKRIENIQSKLTDLMILYTKKHLGRANAEQYAAMQDIQLLTNSLNAMQGIQILNTDNPMAQPPTKQYETLSCLYLSFP